MRSTRNEPSARPPAGALALLSTLFAASCGESREPLRIAAGDWPVTVELPADPEPLYPRVVLFTIDTLRADHVSAYGYRRTTTPFLDSLAQQGVLFTRANSTISQTAPSHASMLTGLPPLVHGVLDNSHELGRDAVDLARVFGAAGFETAACVNTKFLQGVAHSFGSVHAATGRGDDVVRLATTWLEKERKGERFFLWVHVFDPHRWKNLQGLITVERARRRTRGNAPVRDSEFTFHGETPPDFERYVMELHGLDAPSDASAPPVQTRKDGESVDFESHAEYLRYVDAYDAMARLADGSLAALYHAIEALALPGPTLWIVTADHGEGLASHGLCGHGGHIYQEQLSIPLLIHASDKSLAPRRVGAVTSHLDLYPTLVETLHGRVLAPEGLLDGRSLWPLVRGEPVDWSERAVFSQRTPSGEALYSVQTARFKLLDNRGADGPDELYDLGADPRERANLVQAGSAEHETLARELEQRLRVFEAHARQSDAEAIPADWMGELRDLGYVR